MTRDLVQAEHDYMEALDIYELLKNEYGCNKVRHRLAMIKLKREQYLEAERDFRAVERTSRRLGDMKRLSYSLHRRGEIRAHFGDFREAQKLLKESIAIKKRMGHLRGLVYSLAEMGRVAALQGELKEAAHNVEQAFALVLKLDMPKEEAFVSSMMAFVRLQLGNRGEAENWMLRARRIYSELGLTKRADEATLDSIERSIRTCLTDRYTFVETSGTSKFRIVSTSSRSHCSTITGFRYANGIFVKSRKT